jgi:hypothetical protein
MQTIGRKVLVTGLTLAAAALSASAAQAQPFAERPRTGPVGTYMPGNPAGYSGGVGQQRFYSGNDPRPVYVNGKALPNIQQLNPNTNPYIQPGLTLGQWKANQTTINRVNNQIPPYQLGYNPYPSPVINNGPVYPSPYNPGPYAPYNPSPYNQYNPSPYGPNYPSPYGPNYPSPYGPNYPSPYSPFGPTPYGPNAPTYFNPYTGQPMPNVYGNPYGLATYPNNFANPYFGVPSNPFNNPFANPFLANPANNNNPFVNQFGF